MSARPCSSPYPELGNFKHPMNVTGPFIRRYFNVEPPPLRILALHSDIQTSTPRRKEAEDEDEVFEFVPAGSSAPVYIDAPYLDFHPQRLPSHHDFRIFLLNGLRGLRAQRRITLRRIRLHAEVVFLFGRKERINGSWHSAVQREKWLLAVKLVPNFFCNQDV